MVQCRIGLLDESEIEVGVDVHANGRELFENVCKYLNVVETDYFGLFYKGTIYQNVWVNLDKPLKKQFPIQPPSWAFSFAVKYYPTDPSYLREEITKYQLCLQIRDDLMNGRLTCPLDTLALLSSYWLQSEFGDGEEESEEVRRYLTSLRYISDSDSAMSEFEKKVQRLYKTRRGMPPCDADTQFLRLASTLPLYGVHPYTAEDKKGVELKIGVGSSGIVEIAEKQNVASYTWNHIKNINYKKSKFYVKLLASSSKEHSTKKSYRLKTGLQARALWRNAVDHHVFFRVTASDTTSSGPSANNSPQTRGKYISKKRIPSFRLSFRKKQPKTEAEVREESARIKRPNPIVVRHSNLRRSPSDKSNTPDSKENPKTEDEEPKSTPLRSILKNQGSSDENAEAKSSTEEEDGRRVTNDDLRIPTITCKDDLTHGGSSLLLTETIPEEEEEEEEGGEEGEEYIEDAVKVADSVDEPDINLTQNTEAPTEVQDDNEPVAVSSKVEEDQQTELQEDLIKPIQCPVIVTIEVCPEPNVNPSPAPEVPKLFPPPLLTQNTNDAMKLVCHLADGDDDADQTEEKPANVQIVLDGGSDVPREQIVMQPDDASPEQPDASPLEEVDSAICTSEGDGQHSGGGNDDDEDDRRTVGASSAVAVLGDDDITIRDLADDVNIEGFTEYGKIASESGDDSLDDDEDSHISESSGSSVSDITDNTEELCNPNILDIIWSKCSGFKEFGEPYHKLFGIKLRKHKGRVRKAKSSLFEGGNYHSVSTQIPTPPPTDDSSKEAPYARVEDRISQVCEKRRFIPSWPFDQDSLAFNTELDDLDREAIKAALEAQHDWSNGIDSQEISLRWDDRYADEEQDQISNNYDDGTPRDVADSIPGIPLFAKSLGLAGSSQGTCESKTSTRRSSTASTVSSCVKPKEPGYVMLVYPPDIETYQGASEVNQFLVYAPEVETINESTINKTNTESLGNLNNEIQTSESEDVESLETLEEREDDEESTEEKSAEAVADFEVADFTAESPAVASETILKHDFTECLLSENSESGRSTPSGSSFPGFIHSVFPLRKSSSASERRFKVQPASSEEKIAAAAECDGDEFSTSISECSNISVRGSTDESSQCDLDDKSQAGDDRPATPTTRITVVDFINENCSPESVQAEMKEDVATDETPASLGEDAGPDSGDSTAGTEDTLPYTEDAGTSTTTDPGIHTPNQEKGEPENNKDQSDHSEQQDVSASTSKCDDDPGLPLTLTHDVSNLQQDEKLNVDEATQDEDVGEEDHSQSPIEDANEINGNEQTYTTQIGSLPGQSTSDKESPFASSKKIELKKVESYDYESSDNEAGGVYHVDREEEKLIPETGSANGREVNNEGAVEQQSDDDSDLD